jgi:hypothetical protein
MSSIASSSRIGRWTLVLLLFVTVNTVTSFAPFQKPPVKTQMKPIVEKVFNPFGKSLPLSEKSIVKLDAKLTEAQIEVLNSKTKSENETYKWRAVVLGICIIWSTNFAVIKEIFHAAPTIDPSLYAAIRFSLAALVMLPRTFNSLGNAELVVSSMTVGLSVFFGYFGQAVGLVTTTANKSSFICSLNVVWVALLSSLIKKEFKTQTWVSALLAVLGGDNFIACEESCVYMTKYIHEYVFCI